jgi:hypothetical protein
MSTAVEELNKLADLVVLSFEQKRGGLRLAMSAAKELEGKGWRAWYAAIFGQSFIDSLDSAETDDKHHSEAIEWHWNARRALLQGERPPNDWFAFFPTWARGNMKSTIAEALVITDAGLSSLYNQPGFCLYLRREKDKLQESISNIESLLSSEKVRALFPLLSQVARNDETNQKRQWTATFLHTKAGYVIRGGTIRSSQAGSRIGKTRPTFVVPDDIEGREDSPVISEGNFKALTTEVIPMRQENTLTFWAQNLISRYTARYRIEKGHAHVLANRKPTVPVPAVRELVTDPQTVGGIVKDVFVSGRSTWRVWTHQRIQDEIDAMGLPAFLKECQHEVEQDTEGLVLKNYNDAIHVISLSEFESIFGTREIPRRWYKYAYNDFARTKTKHHANVAGIVTVSSQNESLPGCVFLFHPMSFPGGTQPEEVAIRLLTAISPTVTISGRQWTWGEMMQSSLQNSNLENFISDTTRLIEERRNLWANVIPERVRPILKAQNYQMFRGSHEQSKTGALAVYRRVFGLPFVGVNPGGDGGVDSLNMLMRVDYNLPHRVRAGQQGYTNFHIVVPDDRSGGPIYVTEDGVEVYPPVPYNESLTPDDLHDHDLLRYQFRNCRFRDPHLTAKGEHEGDILKLNDDFINGLMMLFYDGCVRAAPLTHDEKIVEAIPEKYRLEELFKNSPFKNGLLPEQQMAYEYQRARAEKIIKPRNQSFDEWFEPTD